MRKTLSQQDRTSKFTVNA